MVTTELNAFKQQHVEGIMVNLLLKVGLLGDWLTRKLNAVMIFHKPVDFGTSQIYD